MKNSKMNWLQAKRKYPSMKRYGDNDLDGTLNYKDCKPLNAKEDGIFGAIAGAVKGVFSGGSGAVKKGWSEGMAKPGYFAKRKESRYEERRYNPQRAKRLVIAKQMETRQANYEKAMKERKAKEFAQRPIQRFGRALTQQIESPGTRRKVTKYIKDKKTGEIREVTSIVHTPLLQKSVRRGYTIAGGVAFRPPSTKTGHTRTGRVGRPAGLYKYRNPITGKPIHVWEYRRVVSALKRQNQGIAAQRDQIEQIRMARQGIPPEQARVLVDSRQIRQAVSTGNQGEPVRPQIYPQQQLSTSTNNLQQAEYQRIQTQVVPWARRAAMNRLIRQQQIAQMQQQQNQMQVQNTEVSLMDGKAYPKDVTANQRREKWTYS